MHSKIIGFGVAALIAAPATAFCAASYGDWGADCRMGNCESLVRNGPGNEFLISCWESPESSKDGASLFLLIKDKSPTTGEVSIVIDGEEIKLGSDKGDVDTTNHANADNFIEFQKRILHAKSPKMFVKFPNGDSSSFSLKGVKGAFGDAECWTGFYGPKEQPHSGKRRR